MTESEPHFRARTGTHRYPSNKYEPEWESDVLRYPQWKIDLFRSRNAHVCACFETWLPESQSTRLKFNPDCPVHGDADTREGRSIVENDAIQAEDRRAL